MLTGRSSSSAPEFNKKLVYAGRNAQNVDPRIRSCTIPREGNIIISTDYSGMELATLAQKCYDLFGFSVLRDKINADIDTHAYLASQIALNMDDGFAVALQAGYVDVCDSEEVFEAFFMCKGSDMTCDEWVPMTCKSIREQFLAEHDKEFEGEVTWGQFFKYYRKLAKPVGLGFPGGLGTATMVIFAKGTYKTTMTEEVARRCRKIWLETYPEMEMYLLWIKNHCKDENHKGVYGEVDGHKRLQQFFSYETPFGMHRARCKFTECANGAGLQAFAAEGALGALWEVQKAMWQANMVESICSYLEGCYAINFIHDEILWECPDDDMVDARIEIVDRIMVDCMEIITPDVKARTESVAMRRWYKEAEAVYENGKLIPWEPEQCQNLK